MSGVSKVYQSVSNAMCRKRSNHKELRAFRPGFDSPRSHLESLGNKAFLCLKKWYVTRRQKHCTGSRKYSII